MNDTTVYVGLDVHKDTITTAWVGHEPEAPVVDFGTLGTQQYAIDRMLKKIPGRPKLVYEAGPCGFWLYRYLTAKGLDCVVTAPSLIPKKPGVRIKTDRRDARNLALGLKNGGLTLIHVPTPEQEQFRDVVRAWQQAKRDVTASRQRLKAFLLRHDIRYTGRAGWSAAHRRWLSRAQQQLHIHYKKLTARGKDRNVVVTAVGRELTAFIWDAAHLVPAHR